MTVDELRTILEHLPGDLPVHVRSRFCCHIDVVQRRTPLTFNPAGGRYPSALILGGYTPWFKPEPAIELRGPFRRRAELDRRLGALTIDAAPESEER